MKAIEVQETFKVPGTDFVLEAGQKFEVLEKVLKEAKMIKMEFKDFVKEASEKPLTFAGLNFLTYGNTPAGVPKKTASQNVIETDIRKAEVRISSTSVTAEMTSGAWMRISLTKKNIVNVFKWGDLDLPDTYLVLTTERDGLILTTAKDRKGI